MTTPSTPPAPKCSTPSPNPKDGAKTNPSIHLDIYSQSKPSFYDLPSINSNRSTSFGYGNKIDIGKRGTITPSPLNYTIHGDFDRTERKNGITMGLGREVSIIIIFRTSRTSTRMVLSPLKFPVRKTTMPTNPQSSSALQSTQSLPDTSCSQNGKNQFLDPASTTQSKLPKTTSTLL